MQQNDSYTFFKQSFILYVNYYYLKITQEAFVQCW